MLSIGQKNIFSHLIFAAGIQDGAKIQKLRPKNAKKPNFCCEMANFLQLLKLFSFYLSYSEVPIKHR
jgi:hypothetical protein